MNNLSAIILVLSYMFFPGPKATHNFACPLQELVTSSQGRPVFKQCGPLVLGETSPKFVDAKAATNGP